jgi:hypothetical protein
MFKKKPQRLTVEQYATIADTLGKLQDQRALAMNYAVKDEQLKYTILINQILSKTTGVTDVA